MFANLWTDTGLRSCPYTLCRDRRFLFAPAVAPQTLPRNASGPNPRPRPRQYAMWISSDHRISPAATVCRVERSSDSLGPQKTIYRFLVCETGPARRIRARVRNANIARGDHPRGRSIGIEAKRAARRRIRDRRKSNGPTVIYRFRPGRGANTIPNGGRRREEKNLDTYMCVYVQKHGYRRIRRTLQTH